jgi:hypothetical protein
VRQRPGAHSRPAFVDYVWVQDGLIIERVQQADVLGQMRPLYGKALGLNAV